jgi:PAS domain S-box-containing protein
VRQHGEGPLTLLDKASLAPMRVRWGAYLLAAATSAATLALRLALGGWFGDRPVLILFVLPIFLSAYVGGLGPGLLATLLAALSTAYFLLPPLHSFDMARSLDTCQWLLLIVVGVLISALTGARLKQLQREAGSTGQRGDLLPERKVQLGFAFALSCLAVIGTMSFNSVTRLSEEADRTRHTEEVIVDLELLLSSATDVETAQRGYTITGDDSFLEPYSSARPRIGAQLAELRHLTRDDAEQQRRLERLAPLLAERIENAAQNVQLRQKQGFDAARLAVASGSGKALHDRVRALIAEMTNAELTLLAERQRVARHVAALTHTVIAGGSALAIFCVAVALFVVGRDFAGSRRAEAELQKANEQLEARVRERTAALAGSEARLGGIVASALDSIISVNREQRVVLFNTAAERLFGWTASAALGQPLDLFIRAGFGQQPLRVEDFGAAGVHSRSTHAQRALRADGTELPIDASMSQVEVAGEQIFTVILRDISDRQRAERVSALLAALVESSSDAILSKDLQGIVTSWNAGAERMFGYTAAEMLGRSNNVLIAPENQAEAAEILAQIQRGARVEHFETLRLRKDGSAFPVSVTVSPIRDPSGRIVGASKVLRDISDRKRADDEHKQLEQRLHAADRRLAEIVQGMNEACFALDAEWRFSFVNDRVETLLHHTREQMLGRSIWEVFHWLVGTSTEVNYRRAMSERVPVSFEVYATTAERWLDIRIFPTGEGLAAFLLDIHARKMAELEREKFVALAKNSHEFIGMRSLEGAALFVNEAALKLVGLGSLEEAARVSPAQFFFPEDQAFVQGEFVPRVLKDGHGEVEIRFRHFKTGEAIWMIYNAFVLRGAQGEPLALATVSRNITERKRAEQQIRQLNADLEHRVSERTAELEAANQELEAFSYSVSHDLRAPLRTVDGFSQILLDDYGPELPVEAGEHLKAIRGGARRMNTLIDDLLRFARFSRLPLEKGAVDTEQLVRDTLAELSAAHSGREPEIHLGELPNCTGDLALLKQVWVNLLSNAFKYSNDRAQAVVEIGALRQGSTTAYFVRDNGTGFDMRYAGKLFGVFQRLHRQDEFEGTGVGLAIVQRIVKRHGGRIWADAAIDRGATFYFTLEGDAPVAS